MYYLGIDIGKREHTAGVINEQGEKVGAVIRFKPSYKGWQKLMKHLDKLNQEPIQDSIKVGLEATGHYWLTLYEKLKKEEFDVTVFNPLQIASLRNKSIRGQKTDTVDAILVAEVLRIGEESQTRLPDEEVLTLRRFSRFRADLVDQITRTKRKILAILDQVFPEYEDCFKNAFGKGSLALLSEYPLPEEVAKLDLEKLTKLLKKTSRNHFGEDEAKKIKNKAQNSFGLKAGLDAFEVQIKILVEQIKHIESQVKKVEKEIKGIVDGHVLLTIPGVSHTTAGLILGEIGNFERFLGQGGTRAGIKSLTALAGLDARLWESGQYKGKITMSKRGSRYLRRAVMQSSFVACQYDPMFKAVYEKQKKRGKHHYVALSHVGRKLLGVIYAVLRDQKPYYPVL